MFKTETLDTLKDEELQAVNVYAVSLLKKRTEERERDAVEKARAILAGVGKTFKDVVGKSRGGNGRSEYKAGTQYQHPEKKELTWSGKGQKPNWIRDLETAGKRPLEAAA
jgi:DNA-binding protein H-NS